jgi:hydroxyacylglutathione hydrolase
LALHVLDVPGHTRGHIAYYLAGDTMEQQKPLPSTVGNTLTDHLASCDIPPAQFAPHLFCGDTLFSCGCGRLFEGTPAQMLASLDTFAALPDATLVHCAHEYTLNNIRFARAVEPDNAALRRWEREAMRLRAMGNPTVPTTLGHEKQVNPFLRTDVPQVQRAAQQKAGVASEGASYNRLQTFTILRAWKDQFK